MYLKMLLTALVVSAAIPAFPQAVPEAKVGGLPLKIGVGYSNYHTDWNGRMGGPMLWIDWDFYGRPSFLHGFGIEAETRDLNYNRTGPVPQLRMDTAAGGLIYTVRHYRRITPYAKFLIGYGSIDFNVGNPTYTHDTRTVYAPAGGVEYRLYRNVWVRGNYEYQFWPDLFNHHALNPNGITVGVAYNLRGTRGR